MRALFAGLKVDSEGALTLARMPSDQRYSQPFSGLYWQILQDGKVIEKSRSVWDEELALPEDILPTGGYHEHTIDGPRGRSLLAIEKAITVKRGSEAFVFRASVALDRSELTLAVKAFRSDLALGLGALGAALIATFRAGI